MNKNDRDFTNKKAKILVVEDDRTTRELICAAMEDKGHFVFRTTNGEECLEKCQQLQPDLILLDGIMPKMDGFECCKRLQEVLKEDCPPVLMITSLDDRESEDRAFAVGATDYVTKPIHWPVLFQRVKRLLQTHWAMQELEKLNKELSRLASLDGLTQIPNRRSFDDYLGTEWNRMAREKSPLSLILCDVDYFKLYNDTYGHQAGDRCLQQVAEILDKQARRPADFVARYGGEEFAVVLPKTQAAGAIEVAEIMRARVKSLNLAHSASNISRIVTLSVGVSSIVPTNGWSIESLIEKADRALYMAKQQGRDRVIANVIY
jgi:diguanylate cyclase (GGDEF)-like protein